jgi:hypothetical protein
VGREMALLKGTLFYITGGKWNHKERWPFPKTMLFSGGKVEL